MVKVQVILTRAEKISRLEDCIAMLQDVDVAQQTVLGELSEQNHYLIEDLIDLLEDAAQTVR